MSPNHSMEGSFAHQVLHRLVQRPLLPFYFLLVLYMAGYMPDHQSVPKTHFVAVFKILPILYLIFNLLRAPRASTDKDSRRDTIEKAIGQREATHKTLAPKQDRSSYKPWYQLHHLLWCPETGQASVYRSNIFRGLLVSILGDVLLVYRSYFLQGIFAFSIAQLCYLRALKQKSRRKKFCFVSIAMGAVLYMILAFNIQSTKFVVVVFIYNILIHGMLFFALSSYETNKTVSSFLGAAGAFLFVISDFTIGYVTWVQVLPYSAVLIMLTYYFAQLCLSMSAF